MNSIERKEQRYLRRKQKREQKRTGLCDKTYDEVFNFLNLYKAGKGCCEDVRWKTSTINYETSLLTNIEYLDNEMQNFKNNRKHCFDGFKHFITYEHSKKRDINALTIKDRTKQRCFCDNVMTKAYSRSYITDNGASLPGKGITFTIDKLKYYLQEHYRRYGLEGGILQFDFSGYFASIPHKLAKERACKHLTDNDLQDLSSSFIDEFLELREIEQEDKNNTHGVGLGSQVSQNIALDAADPLDHYIKEKYKVKGYARYMDDGYIISNSLDELKQVEETIFKLSEKYGLKISKKKTKITPFKNHSFVFLKLRIRLQENGVVTVKINRKRLKAQRRKMRLFKTWIEDENSNFSFEDVATSFASWRGYIKRHSNSYKTLHKFDKTFIEMYKEELAEYRRKIKCSFDAIWTEDYGWIYYENESNKKKILDKLDKEYYNRRNNGFVPLCNRYDYYSKEENISNKAMAFRLFRNTIKLCV